MQNEKVIDLPPVLFKSAGEVWGNDDNLWVRLNGMADNLFVVDNYMAGETAIFKTGGQAWVITRAQNVFGKCLTRRYIDNKLNILCAKSNILGKPDWSDREVLTFLIEQIVQMPTIDPETLARDVFVDGQDYWPAGFGKVNNSSFSGSRGMTTLPVLAEAWDLVMEPGMSNNNQASGCNSFDATKNKPSFVDYPHFLNIGKRTGVLNEALQQACLERVQNYLSSRLPEYTFLCPGSVVNKSEGDIIVGIDPGQPESEKAVSFLNVNRGKHRDAPEGAVARNKYMTYDLVKDFLCAQRENILKEAAVETEVLFTSIKDTIKDGEARSESEQYLAEHGKPGKE